MPRAYSVPVRELQEVLPVLLSMFGVFTKRLA